MNVNTDNMFYHVITEQKRQAVVVRSEIERLTNKFFFEKGYVWVDPPVLHESIANKKSEVYVPLDNGKYSLSSSNALYMGMYASEFKKVFTISKCFRDEKDDFNHLVEFRILEAEMIDCFFNNMLDIINSYISFILSNLLDSKFICVYSDLVERINQLQNKFVPRIMRYDDFVSELSDDVYDKNIDISDVDYLISKQLTDVVIIVDYPTKFATWTAKNNGNGTSKAMNILLPETYGELCEGCERTNDFTLLQKKIKCAKADSIQWYADSVKKIQTNRCGFGLGIDRLVRWIIGADSISNTRIFPRVKEA